MAGIAQRETMTLRTFDARKDCLATIKYFVPRWLSVLFRGVTLCGTWSRQLHYKASQPDDCSSGLQAAELSPDLRRFAIVRVDLQHPFQLLARERGLFQLLISHS